MFLGDWDERLFEGFRLSGGEFGNLWGMVPLFSVLLIGRFLNDF